VPFGFALGANDLVVSGLAADLSMDRQTGLDGFPRMYYKWGTSSGRLT
jgi:hypothetical protein